MTFCLQIDLDWTLVFPFHFPLPQQKWTRRVRINLWIIPIIPRASSVQTPDLSWTQFVTALSGDQPVPDGRLSPDNQGRIWE